MTVGWTFFSWYNVVVFPVTEAPRFKRGFAASICLIVFYTCLFVTGYLLWQRDIKRGFYERDSDDAENEERVDILCADGGGDAGTSTGSGITGEVLGRERQAGNG